MGIVFIIVGCLGVIIGLLGREFTAADPDASSSFDRKVSTRSGRIVFVLAGVLLIAAGAKLLFFAR